MASTVALVARRHLALALPSVLTGVSVTYSHPGMEQLGAEAVWFMSPRAERVEPQQHRAVKIRRHENLVLPMRIAVQGDGMTEEQAEDRCFEIFGLFDDWLALQDQTHLKGAPGRNQQIYSCTISGWQAASGPHGNGHWAGLTVPLAIDAASL